MGDGIQDRCKRGWVVKRYGVRFDPFERFQTSQQFVALWPGVKRHYLQPGMLRTQLGQQRCVPA